MGDLTPEGRAMKKVRLGASSLRMRIFRNNNGALKDQNGRVVFYGLGNEPEKLTTENGKKRLNQIIKFGDYIGATQVTITPDMVGKTLAVFTNIEVKPDGKLESTLRKAQNNPDSREGCQLKAINLVSQWGGIAGFATNEFDLQNIFTNFLRQFNNDN